MLLKYLNQLESAVNIAQQQPGLDSYARCADCLFVLRDYLRGQIEPVRTRGEEIIEQLLPVDFDQWMAQVLLARPGQGSELTRSL